MLCISVYHCTNTILKIKSGDDKIFLFSKFSLKSRTAFHLKYLMYELLLPYFLSLEKIRFSFNLLNQHAIGSITRKQIYIYFIYFFLKT